MHSFLPFSIPKNLAQQHLPTTLFDAINPMSDRVLFKKSGLGSRKKSLLTQASQSLLTFSLPIPSLLSVPTALPSYLNSLLLLSMESLLPLSLDSRVRDCVCISELGGEMGVGGVTGGLGGVCFPPQKVHISQISSQAPCSELDPSVGGLCGCMFSRSERGTASVDTCKWGGADKWRRGMRYVCSIGEESSLDKPTSSLTTPSDGTVSGTTSEGSHSYFLPPLLTSTLLALDPLAFSKMSPYVATVICVKDLESCILMFLKKHYSRESMLSSTPQSLFFPSISTIGVVFDISRPYPPFSFIFQRRKMSEWLCQVLKQMEKKEEIEEKQKVKDEMEKQGLIGDKKDDTKDQDTTQQPIDTKDSTVNPSSSTISDTSSTEKISPSFAPGIDLSSTRSSKSRKIVCPPLPDARPHPPLPDSPLGLFSSAFLIALAPHFMFFPDPLEQSSGSYSKQFRTSPDSESTSDSLYVNLLWCGHDTGGGLYSLLDIRKRVSWREIGEWVEDEEWKKGEERKEELQEDAGEDDHSHDEGHNDEPEDGSNQSTSKPSGMKSSPSSKDKGLLKKMTRAEILYNYLIRKIPLDTDRTLEHETLIPAILFCDTEDDVNISPLHDVMGERYVWPDLE
ncbi:hypothetical protein ADUPG1_011423 [Aduncisulcus paluster]|uniref:Uncharacterized protein n=1 Tax=Aduncisulcus paluster TaxID=2918883 RepID=A0ABQ5JXK1_9EUKA|nr:hypothetical protein ADUPG1_011423 [Aduncisulcus paluster]